MHWEPSMCSAGLVGSKAWLSHFKPQRECKKEMVSENWYASWEAARCYTRGREFMSLLSHTGRFTSPGSFSQLKPGGIEMNSSLSVLTCCVLWLSGPKSGFFLLALGAAIGSQPSGVPPLIFPVSILDNLFLPSAPQFLYWGNSVLLPASRCSSGSYRSWQSRGDITVFLFGMPTAACLGI